MNKTVEHRQLNRDAAFVYGGYLLRYLSLIVLLPFYSRVLGPTGYGKVLAAMALVSIVWLVVNYGFSITGARDLASVSSPIERNRIFTRQLVARVMLIPLGIAVGAVGTLLSPILVADPLYGVLATLMGLCEAFNLGWFFQGLRRFRTSIAIEGMFYPLSMGLVLILVRTPEDGIRVFAALLLSMAVVLGVSYTLAFRTVQLVRPSPSEGWREIRGSTVIFIQGVNGVLTTAGATYVLSMLSTPEEVSFFGTAERFVAVALSLFGPAGQVLMPTIANLHVDAAHEAFRLARKALRLEVAFGVVSVIAGVSLAPFVLPFILGDEFGRSVLLLQILVCLMPFAAVTHALGLYLLVPLRREKLLLTAISVGTIINLSFGVFAAQAWDSVGMAVARVAGEALSAILLAALCMRIKRD